MRKGGDAYAHEVAILIGKSSGSANEVRGLVLTEVEQLQHRKLKRGDAWD